MLTLLMGASWQHMLADLLIFGAWASLMRLLRDWHREHMVFLGEIHDTLLNIRASLDSDVWRP